MENNILVYIPSDSKEASHLAMKRLLGIPIFLRGILTLAEAGYKKITLAAPINERRHVLKALEHHVIDNDLRIHIIWTRTDLRLNSTLFGDILENAAERLYIINSNLLVTKTALKPWVDIKLRKGEHLKAIVDRGIPPLISVNKRDMERLKEKIAERPMTVDEILGAILKETQPHRKSSGWAEPVKLLGRFSDRKDGARFLTETIRQSTPTWIARNINKRISLPISIVLAHFRIHPNTITVFNMFIGMAASIGAAGRTYTGLLVGAILFQLASIVDGCDGEVAKLTHRCSKFGQYIDSISDNLALAGFFTGLMIHVYRVNNHTPFAFVLGGTLLAGIFITIGFMIRFLKRHTNSASFATFDKEYLQRLSVNYPRPLLILIKYGKYTLKKDFFSLLFLVLAIFGILPLAFYVSILGCYIGIGVLVYLNLRPEAAAARKKLVVFDFDGTLVNSMETFANIASRVMHTIYGTPLDEARRRYIETSGLPFFQQLEQIYPGHRENKRAAELYENEKVIGYFDQETYPDAAKATSRLKEHGVLTAVSSNNFQHLVDEYMKRSDIKLDYVLGFESDAFCKGRPHFEHLVKKTGLRKEEVVFVGDSLKDAERAAEANIDFIGKTGLFSKEEFNKHSPASPVIDRLDELVELFVQGV